VTDKTTTAQSNLWNTVRSSGNAEIIIFGDLNPPIFQVHDTRFVINANFNFADFNFSNFNFTQRDKF